MIKAKDAITVARSLLGTPYADLDCINLIKKVIRTAPDGVPGYTTAGTNSLWDSYEASAKYRDLTWRQEGISGAKAGMIAFKHDGEEYHHAGIVTDVGTVIHSSSTQGGRGVVETPLTTREGWNALAIHRYIETAEEEETVMYKAKVDLDNPKSFLNLRNGPSTKNRVIGSIPNDASVEVLAEADGWAFVRYGGQSGYVSAGYLEREDDGELDAEDMIVPAKPEEQFTTIMNTEGTAIRLEGVWRVAED